MLINLTMQQVGAMSLSEIASILSSIAQGANTASPDTLTLLNLRYQSQIDLNQYPISNLSPEALLLLANELISQGLLSQEQVTTMLLEKVDNGYVSDIVGDAIAALVSTSNTTIEVLSALSSAINHNDVSIENLTYAVRYDKNTQNLTSLQKQNALTNIGATSPANVTGLISSAISANNTTLTPITSFNALQEQVDGLEGGTGTDGKTAYELAVEEGFVGTLPEWLLSLKGEPGGSGTGDYNDLINKPILSAVALSNSYNDLDDKPVGGIGGGSPFQVIEWDPITFGTPSPVVFTAGVDSILTSTTLNSATVNSNTLIPSPGVTLEYCLAATTISNNLSGIFNINNIGEEYAPRMLIFSSTPITSEILFSMLRGNTVPNVAGYLTLTNGIVIGSPGLNVGLNLATGSVAATTQDPTQLTITFNNGEIGIQDLPSVSGSIDFDTYGILTLVTFADYMAAFAHTVPNPAVELSFINNLSEVEASESEIPSEATDGTILKVIGHDGVLLGRNVLTGDECTLFDNLSSFLLNRSFDTDLDIALDVGGPLHDSIPQIQTFVDTIAPIVLNAPISIANHTYTEDQDNGTAILISKDVRSGTVVLVNKTPAYQHHWLAANVPFKYVYLNGVITDSGYNDNSGYIYPDYREVFNSIQNPPFTTTIIDINFNNFGGVVKTVSQTVSEAITDLTPTEPILVLNDVDENGTLEIAEHVNDTFVVRVPLVGKKAGYFLRILSSQGSQIGFKDFAASITYDFYNGSLYSVTQEDITTGYVDFIITMPNDITSNISVSLYSVFAIYKTSNPNDGMIYGDILSTTITYQVPSQPIGDYFSAYHQENETLLTADDPDNILQEISASAQIAASYTGTIYFNWIYYGLGDPISQLPNLSVGDVIRFDTKVSTAGGKESIAWDSEATQPIISGVINGFYTITQTDINNGYKNIGFEASNSYPEQFIKFTVSFQHAGDNTPATPEVSFIVFISGVDNVLGYGPSLGLQTNYDLEPPTYLDYSSITLRPYTDIISGETSADFAMYNSYALGTKVAVKALVSDMPNTGFGLSSIAPPDISAFNGYEITQTDVDNSATPISTITFDTPSNDAPYFVKVISQMVDVTTSEPVSEIATSYFIIHPLIDTVTISGEPDINIENSYHSDYQFTFPTQAITGDTLAVSTLFSNMIIGYPFNLTLDSTAIIDGSFIASTNFYSFTNTIDIIARILRDNSTGIPVKGKRSTFTVTIS